MWHVLSGSGGDEVFSRWFCQLLEHSSAYQTSFEKARRKREKDLGFDVYDSSEEEEEDVPLKKKKGKKNVKYVSVSSVYSLHKLLTLEELYGVSKTSFVALCLEAAKEKKFASKEDYVPLPILKDFAFEFTRGLTRLMHRLGFSRSPALEADDE
jgi:hypothetical protein